MENKRIILPTKKYYNSPEEDLNLRITLDESKNLLREGDRTIILDTSTVFDKERNASSNYKIHGKIKMVFRNMYSGETDYYTLAKNLYLVGNGSDGKFEFGFLPFDEFSFLRRDVIREINTPRDTAVLSAYTPSIAVSGGSPHMSITSIEAPYHNWNLYLSYVYSGDSSFPMTYTLSGGTLCRFIASDGIPFRVTDYGTTYKLTCPVEHGMSVGEYITISGGTLNSYITVSARTFTIVSVGDETYNSDKFVLDIAKAELPAGTTFPTIILGKRCIKIDNITGTTSTYYVHKHKTLTVETDYILDKAGFESPIWEDEKKILFENIAGENDVLVTRNRMESLIYDFKNSFVLTGLTNNLGFLPTDVYVSVILINGNGYFTYPPKVGYKFNFHDTWMDEHFNGNTSVETTIPITGFSKTITGTGAGTFYFTGGTEIPLGTILTGAFIEYNDYELKERVVSEAFHKFGNPPFVLDYNQTGSTTFSGASVTNPFGYYYQPHHRVKLRQLSPYVELSETKEVYGLPQNAKYFGDELLWKWRDLYDHGFIDPDGFGTNFPFINNIHYVKSDINFYLRNEQLYSNKTDGVKKVTKFKC